MHAEGQRFESVILHNNRTPQGKGKKIFDMMDNKAIK